MFRKEETKDFICKYRNFFVTLCAEKNKSVKNYQKFNKKTIRHMNFWNKFG